LEDCFAKLGPHIRSCHAKDTRMQRSLTVHLQEVPPGAGALDYRTYIRLAEQVDPQMPFIIEHLSADQVPAAADFLRRCAAEVNA
jgi:sugar phosphate isomerase/epimerase